MTAQDTQSRSERAQHLKVFQVGNDCYVESSEGKIAYKVLINNGDSSCTCGDYTSNSKKDPEFKCKHILATLSANGNTLIASTMDKVRPKLDDRFITSIQGKDFAVYNGLLDLATQKGLRKIHVEVIQFPTKDNGSEAICRAIVESKQGESFIEWGDANPRNVNPKIAQHLLRMAATRAKARALRDFTNIGMTCLEELGDLDEVLTEENSNQSKVKKANNSKKGDNGNGSKDHTAQQRDEAAKGQQEKTSPPETKESKEEPSRDAGPKPSTAQLKAIENLARRRNISSEELEEMVQQQFGTTLPNINSSEASTFIRHLQQSA